MQAVYFTLRFVRSKFQQLSHKVIHMICG